MIWLSLPLGLLSWLLPILFRNKKIKPTAISIVSFGLCVLALLNVLWDLYRTTVSGDYAALMDIGDNLTVCSVALVVGTLMLNLWLHAHSGILRYLERPARFFVVLLITLVVQSSLYIPGMQLAAYIKDRNQMVGMAIGTAISLIAYVGAVPLLFLIRKKESAFKYSWGVPLGILASYRIWNVLFSLTCDYLLTIHALPYEMDDAISTFAAFYLFPMSFISLVLTGRTKWETLRKRRSEATLNET